MDLLVVGEINEISFLRIFIKNYSNLRGLMDMVFPS